MPNANAHRHANVASTVLIVALLLLYTPLRHSLILTAGVSSLLGNIFLSPDLDLHYSRPRRAWRKLSWLWFFYERSHRHRGMSHFAIMSTLIRIAYLCLCIFFMSSAVLLYNYALPQALQKAGDTFLIFHDKVGQLVGENFASTYLIAALLGFAFADIIHIFLDFSLSTLKKIAKGL